MLLYLHIPFCHRICPYCSFYKHTPGSTPVGALVDALLAEAACRLPECPSPRAPSIWEAAPRACSPPATSRRLFEGLHSLLDFSSLDEVALEANPAGCDAKKAALFVASGVTRVSLGIQSFAPHVLATLGPRAQPR